MPYLVQNVYVKNNTDIAVPIATRKDVIKFGNTDGHSIFKKICLKDAPKLYKGKNISFGIVFILSRIATNT